jgi:hypothetical protein
MRWLKLLMIVVVAIVSGVFGLAVAWLTGYVSRPVAAATSPDGRVEAVCRGRLPESTEYDLWLREPGEMFGRRVGYVGTESMGRCHTVAWSPGGEVVAVLNEGGTVAVFDGHNARPIGFQRLPAPDGNYPSRRIVTALRFESPTVVTFQHCERLWHKTRRWTDSALCGSELVPARMTLALESPRGSFGR